MDFIERWLHISPDGGNGSSEFIIVTTIVLVIGIGVAAAQRHNLLGILLDYLEGLGKREAGDRFDS